MKKQLKILILAVILCLGMLPLSVYAENVDTEITGYAVPLPEGGVPAFAATSPVPTQQQAYAAMIALKAQYPEGMHWTNDNYYGWKGGIYSGGYGCAGFAFLLSDAAFGDLPARMVYDVSIDKVHVGDILRVNNDGHSVIVMEVYSTYVVLAEGNYNSSIHWGRTYSAAQIAAADYMMTRYPVGTFSEVYTISYDANGGKYPPDAQQKEKNEGLRLTMDRPLRVGYDFLGWALSANATKAVYQPGDIFSTNANTTLYAVWKPVTYPQIENTFPQELTTSISPAGNVAYYAFTPSRSDQYTFESIGNDDTLGAIYSRDGSIIKTSDDDGEGFNFKIRVFLDAGTTYYLGCWFYSSNMAGDIVVRIDAESSVLIQVPGEYDIYIEEGERRCSFIPSRTGDYIFESSGNYDTVAVLRNADEEILVTDDDGGENRNFRIEYHLLAGRTYYLNVWNYSGGMAEFTLHLTMKNEEASVPKIIEEPEDTSVVSGKSFTYTVKATGENLQYQWQYSTDMGSSWINSTSSSAKTATFRSVAKDSWNHRLYRCLITDAAGNTLTSAEAMLVVFPLPKITSQPTDTTVAPGKYFTFSVSTEGEGLTYQWQYSKNNGSSWVSSTMSAAKTETYKTKANLEWDGRLYRCKITDEYGNTVISDTATLHVKAAELVIVEQPSDTMAGAGEAFHFGISATGDGLTYQWQYSSNQGNTWVSSTTSAGKSSLYKSTAKSSWDNRWYRCLVTDVYGNTVISDNAVLHIYVPFEITRQPEDVTVESGVSFTISFAVTGEGLTYQWQYSSNDGASWTNSTTTAKTNYKSTAKKNWDGRLYRCIITDANGDTRITEPVRLNVI